MRRRDLIAMLGSATLTWSAAAQVQQKRLPTVGVMLAASYAEGEQQIKALESALAVLGWIEGRNIHVDSRWADAAHIRSEVAKLVASSPDVLLVAGSPILVPLRQTTNTIPIVFVGVTDPAGLGIVETMARPGGNATGFTNFEPTIGGKWLQTLKEAAAYITDVTILRVATTQSMILQAIHSDAVPLGLKCIDCAIRDGADLEVTLPATLKGRSNMGMIVMPDPLLAPYRSTIIGLAAAEHIPTMYPIRTYPDKGGLMSYGFDLLHQIRQSATYIDRILKGEKPANLPVQAPTKFEFVINLKTAKELGLALPPTLVASADEVIE
jgi:putative tryptophan/tyrosine transport system substrate-binding protein